MPQNQNKVTYGIDRMAFYIPEFYVPMTDLAQARGVDPDKYLGGLGQENMAVLPPDQDIITMGASAAEALLTDDNASPIDRRSIDLVIVATESGLDASKAGAIPIHGLLNLAPNCRTIEIKQACYSSTASVRLAMAHVMQHPSSTVLIIATDNARYGLNAPGEATQGCGALAMTVTQNPSILAIDPEAGYLTKDVMDFWRPSYLDEAIVDGKYSARMYLTGLINTWGQYSGITNKTIDDIDRFVFHLPFSTMADKAYRRLCQHTDHPEDPAEYVAGKQLNQQIGNSYTASLYLSMLSLLLADDGSANNELTGHTLGFYAYGSGSVAEFFTGTVIDGHKKYLLPDYHHNQLTQRQALSFDQYEDYYRFQSKIMSRDQGGNISIPTVSQSAPFVLTRISDHIRQYARS